MGKEKVEEATMLFRIVRDENDTNSADFGFV